MRPRLWITAVAAAGVLGVAAATGTAVVLSSGPPTVDEACATAAAAGPWERQECVAQYYVDQYRQGRPAADINREMQYRYLAGDTWIGQGCHVPTHALGDAVKQTTDGAPSQNLDGMFLYCDVGYAHGLTSEFNPDNPDYTTEDLTDYVNACARYTAQGSRTGWSCDHGIGHIVGTLTYQPDQDPQAWLQAGIEQCEQAQPRDVDACISGHFMIWNLFGSQDLQVNPDGWADRWFTTWPDLCDNLPGKYQEGCLRGIADAHGMYFGPDRPDDTGEPYCPGSTNCPVPNAQETADRCDTYSGRLQVACYQGLGADRALQLRSTPDLIEDICGNAPTKQSQTACFLYALQSFEDPLNTSRCAQLSPQHQWVCTKVTESQDELIREVMGQRELSGATSPAVKPEEFYSDCLALTNDAPLCQTAQDRVRAAGAFPAS